MIHVIDDWYVDVDDRQYISGVLYTRSDGTKELTQRNYHGSLWRALERVVEARKHKKLSKGTIELKEALKTLHDENEEFKKILKQATEYDTDDK